MALSDLVLAGDDMSRVAIVIGVNKPGVLAPLKGAVSDAKAFADWLKKQDFEVKTFTDDVGAVTFADVRAEINRVVRAQTYTQIVIYFAGHGFQSGGSEVWLLSGAPEDDAEAISIDASVVLARESGLGSVVFISDACRSIAKEMQSGRVFGRSVFPNLPLNAATRPDIDRLFATLPSRVAVEAAEATDKARRGGVFTREFMKCYLDPPAEIVQRVPKETGPEVVTNRKLKGRIRVLVEDAAFNELPQAGQLPEFILESEDAYVGRVERGVAAGEMKFSLPGLGSITGLAKEIGSMMHEFARPGERGARRKVARRSREAPSVVALAQEAIAVASQTGEVAAAAAAARDTGHDTEISDAITRYGADVSVHHFETRTGFSVTGAAVVKAVSPTFPAENLGSQLVRLQPEQAGAPSASVLIVFDNGNGVVLPGLRGYIGHVFVEGGVVANVNYVPSDNSGPRWDDYQRVQPKVEALRASVAAAAGLGVFYVAPRQAQDFADKIRELKVFDPTLGLHAAYAYAGAGVDQEIRSVANYMKADLGCELFDVAMLARRGVRPREAASTPPNDVPILPFCPMLRQGWALLAVRDAEVPAAVRAARDWLLPGLWTTFGPDGVALLESAIQRGEFR